MSWRDTELRPDFPDFLLIRESGVREHRFTDFNSGVVVLCAAEGLSRGDLEDLRVVAADGRRLVLAEDDPVPPKRRYWLRFEK